MRKAMLGLLGAALTLLPEVAEAGYWGYARPYPPIVYPGLFTARGYFGYPLDDSFDPPFGYGEYAEYGPWAEPARASCRRVVRRVQTSTGRRNYATWRCW
ncbi:MULTISPECIES: hypothetical protein [Bradyrhizobium]|uniref:hypothetical protein n=2 Tax=Nitrobacteraceae TaxID=41294 RepID=UPI000414B6AF|nr:MULTISPECIES: hypothetical protein [Bradyrhizobium]AUC99061.1 hypothetical protein CWS35_36065 [Bradyrhizobium sp. SK17]